MAKQGATEEGARESEGPREGGGSVLLYYVEHNKTHSSWLPFALTTVAPTAVSDNCVTAC